MTVAARCPAPPAPAVAPAGRPGPPRPDPAARRHSALGRAADLLSEATGERDPDRRFALARLAALSVALGLSAVPAGELARVRAGSPWALLAAVRPDLAGWSARFAASDRRQAALLRGEGGAGGAASADDLLRCATRFLAAATATAAAATATVPAGAGGRAALP